MIRRLCEECRRTRKKGRKKVYGMNWIWAKGLRKWSGWWRRSGKKCLIFFKNRKKKRKQMVSATIKSISNFGNSSPSFKNKATQTYLSVTWRSEIWEKQKRKLTIYQQSFLTKSKKRLKLMELARSLNISLASSSRWLKKRWAEEKLRVETIFKEETGED